MISPRLIFYCHPNRPLLAEEMIRPAYQLLVASLRHKGLSEEEIALAIESLAQTHIDSLATRVEAETELTKAWREAGLYETTDVVPPEPPIWAPVASALIWGCLTAAVLLALRWWAV